MEMGLDALLKWLAISRKLHDAGEQIRIRRNFMGDSDYSAA